MQIEIIEMADRKAQFVLKDSSPAMANALRRTMIQDIPKMAIDKVEFHLGPIMQDDKEYESMTSLFDEVIAHRLGMIPVPTDYDLFTFQDKCVCGGEGCPSCTIMYSLNKMGPCTVYSGDLMPLGNETLKVKDEFIPIVELTDKQAVLIYATAIMGTAKQHVKWQAAFGVGYSYMPVIEIAPKTAVDPDVQKAAELCPRHVFEIKGGKLLVENLRKCSLCKTCTEAPIPAGAIKVHGDDKNFLFKFETDGSLTAKQVLDKALEILVGEAKDFGDQVKALAQ